MQTIDEAMRPDAQLPEDWKRYRITVLLKAGEIAKATNYRPISVISVLYKTFAKLMYKRLEPILDGQQCADQAGFRRGYSTTDHMHTAALILEKTSD